MTDHNPYAPPSTLLGEDRSVAPTPPKPWAVTIMQVLGAAVATMIVVGFTRFFYGMWEWYKIGVTVTWTPSNTGFRVAVFILLVVMLFQLPKRSQIGRWCGVTLLAAALASLIYLVSTTDSSLMQTPMQMVVNVFSAVVFIMLIAWLLYAFAFSRKARAYFGGPARN